jgi:pimeloyl-ACP methyl ester carboxylesterase
MSSFHFHDLGREKIFAALYCFVIVSWSAVTLLARPDDSLHVSRIVEVTFQSQSFEIVGNLYLPENATPPHPLVVWISGSGPSYRVVKNKETVKLVNCFLDRGIAYFRIDKPGCGDSKGKLNDDSLFAQLSTIVVDAIAKFKTNPAVDFRKIGLFGSSQAGYIMPKVISICSDVAFMIGSSCPGENSIDQWNYLLEHQMVCEGTTPERAKKSVEMFDVLRCTSIKSEFDRALEYFEKHPMTVKSVGYDSSFSQKVRSWWPREIDLNDESHLNPMTLIEKTRIPLYLVFGAHDKQIDPIQAISAYKAACEKSGNKRVRIVMLPNCDHNMSLSDGCLNEIESLNRSNSYRLDPAYLETIKEWIEDIIGKKE